MLTENRSKVCWLKTCRFRASVKSVELKKKKKTIFTYYLGILWTNCTVYDIGLTVSISETNKDIVNFADFNVIVYRRLRSLKY